MASIPNADKYKPEDFKIDRGRPPTSASRGIADTGTAIAELGLAADDMQRFQNVTRANVLGNPNAASKLTQSVLGASKGPLAEGASRGARALRVGSNAARLGSLTSPLALYTLADMGTAMYRDDGRGLSEMGGDAIGGAVGKMMYGSGDGYGDNDGMRTLAQENERREAAGEAALSAPESVAFLESLNPSGVTPSANNTNSTTNSTMAPEFTPSLTSDDLSGNPYASMVLGQQTATQGAEKAKISKSLDATGAVKDLDKSEEMQTLREENARREAQGLPNLSAPESVQFLNAVNPETFNALNEKFQNQDQQVVNNFIAQQQAQQAQQAQAGQGAQAPNLQQALAPTGNLPFGGGAAPQGGLIGSYQAPDGQNIGMFQGQPNAPINQQQLDALSGQMVESGAPFISGGMTDESGQTIAGPAGRPEGMKPFVNAMGQVEYADPQTAASMNQIEAQRMQEQKAAQQRAIQSIASRGQVPQEAQQGSPQANFIERMKTAEENPLNKQEIAQGEAMARSMGTTFDPETGYSRDAFLNDRAKPRSSGQPGDRSGRSAYEQASMDREARIAAKPDFNATFGGSAASASDGLSDSQRNKIYGRGSKEAEMSKAGINPQTGRRYAEEEEEGRRQNEYDDARIASLGKTDPTKLQEAKGQVLAIMESMDFNGDQAQRDSTYRQLLMGLLGNMDTFDASTLVG
jgi:hypothetical protein